jgi:hypothetical protein
MSIFNLNYPKIKIPMQELHIDNEKLYTDFFKRLRHSHSFLVRLLGQGQKPYKMPYFDSM